jgi:hypothetical protein
MKSKKILVLAIGMLVLLTAFSLAETTKLKEIGRYTLVRIKGEVPTSEVMKMLVDRYSADIKYGFDLAGYGDLFLPFLDQLKAENFKADTWAIGDTAKWMLFRSHGKTKIVQDVEWAGKEPLPIFTFVVVKDYKHYEFFIPRACGNVSLRSIKEIVPDATCDIQVTPVKANVNDPISIDMSGSQNALSMEVEIIGPDGNRVATQTLNPDSPKWQTKFSTPGEYTFKGKALNAKGVASTNTCETKTYINFPPLCKIWSSCLPCENYVGRPITFDASNSTDPDGEVVKVDFEIKDEMGNVVETFSDTTKPFTLEKVFENPGAFTVTAVVTDDFGAMSEPCKIEGLEVTQKTFFGKVNGAPTWARGSHGPYVAAEVGVFFWLIPYKLDIEAAGGGALALKGEPWKSVGIGHVLLNYHFGPMFVGGGGGFMTSVKEGRKTDFDLIGNVGFDVFNNWNQVGSIFFRVRWPMGSGLSFGNNHKLGVGFRLLF